MHHFYRFVAEQLERLAEKLDGWSSRLYGHASELYWKEHPEELEEMRASLARSRAFMEEIMGDGALLDTATDLGHCDCPSCRARTIN